MNKTIRWQSCSPDAPFTGSASASAAPAAASLELTLVHISSHRIASHWSWLWLASHLISFALQRFVSLLRFALEARAGNGFSLIESKCCSDRMEMAAEMARMEGGGCWCLSGKRCVCAIFQTALEIHVRIAACLKMALVKSATAATAATDNSRL